MKEGGVTFEANKACGPTGVSRFHSMLFITDKLRYSHTKEGRGGGGGGRLGMLGGKVGCPGLQTPPLDVHVEVTGCPYVELWLSSSDTDAGESVPSPPFPK